MFLKTYKQKETGISVLRKPETFVSFGNGHLPRAMLKT